jgi:Arc/MetJ family transcription regulator
MDCDHDQIKRDGVGVAGPQCVGAPLDLDEARALRGTGWDGDLDEMRRNDTQHEPPDQ